MKDITGQVFGSLTALEPSHANERYMWYWKYRCKCGNEHVARANIVKHELRKGDPELPSCGCVELARKTKHGFRKADDTHPAYRVYMGIMSRCYDPNSANYKHYGARGVTVAAEWKDNPEAFVTWALENGWKQELAIDKDILSDKLNIHPHVYSPETCQWISSLENSRYANDRRNYGRHPNVRLSYEDVTEILRLYNSGECTNKSELARMFGLKAPSSIARLIKMQNAQLE